MTPTVLMYGRGDDPPLAKAAEAARRAGVHHVVIDQRDVHRHRLRLEVGGDGPAGEIRIDGQPIPLDAAHGVYARPLDLPGGWPDELGARRAHAFHQAFVEWLDLAPGLVLNRPTAMESNTSKPLQAQLIADAGFAVPATLVTSDPAEVRRFWAAHGRVVFKSISGVRSVVHELDRAFAARLAAVRTLPTQFQAYVPGIDVRVHVVGTRTFATAVTSDTIDYRYAGPGNAALEPTDLPPDVHDRCVRLASTLGLPLCGIDLRRGPDGGWVCFEVNPMPAYSYYEWHTGQPISDAIVALLAAGGREESEGAPWCRAGKTSPGSSAG
jgi:hypothetical protein